MADTDKLSVIHGTGIATWKSGSVLDSSKTYGVISCSKVADMLAPPGILERETLRNLEQYLEFAPWILMRPKSKWA